MPTSPSTLTSQISLRIRVRDLLGILFLWFAISVTAGALLLGLVGSFVIPIFKNTFREFGADIPQLTAFISNYHHWYWILTLGTVILLLKGWLDLEANYFSKTLLVGFIVMGIVETVLFFVTVVALYLPIANLGSYV